MLDKRQSSCSGEKLLTLQGTEDSKVLVVGVYNSPSCVPLYCKELSMIWHDQYLGRVPLSNEPTKKVLRKQDRMS